MRVPTSVFVLAVPAVVAAAAVPVFGQVIVGAASGYATISVAGLGNTTTVAGESRLPILMRDVTYDPAGPQFRLRATGRRGAVRQLDIDVRNARAGQRYDFGPNSAASLRVRMEQGPELQAQQGRGFVQVTTIDAQRVTGTYEGTFSQGSVPVVIRGHFEALFPRAPRARGDAGTAAAPPSGAGAPSTR